MTRSNLPKSTLALVAAALTGAAIVSFAAPAAASPSALSSSGTVRCPENMSLVGKTCVDRYEGSLVEVSTDGSERAYTPFAAPNGHVVKAVSVAGVTPQAHISMVEAQRACKASGKRLCHASEWANACRGPEKHKYPYGDTRVAGACVDTNRASPVRILKGGRYDSTTMNDPRLNQLSNTVELTGATATCTNEYGVHDMVGNVHEWADDGAFHGGYYLDTKINGEGCSYKTTAHAPTYYDYSTGFRCCADATVEPAVPEKHEESLPDTPVSFLGKAKGGDKIAARHEQHTSKGDAPAHSSNDAFGDLESPTANRVSNLPIIQGGVVG